MLVVADGVGGLPRGRSRGVTAVCARSPRALGGVSETVVLRTAILDGIEAANEAVLRLSNGSATTMTVITIEAAAAPVPTRSAIRKP